MTVDFSVAVSVGCVSVLVSLGFAVSSVAVKIIPLCSVENHYLNLEVDELDEKKVNFKSQPNKEKS